MGRVGVDRLSFSEALGSGFKPNSISKSPTSRCQAIWVQNSTNLSDSEWQTMTSTIRMLKKACLFTCTCYPRFFFHSWKKLICNDVICYWEFVGKFCHIKGVRPLRNICVLISLFHSDNEISMSSLLLWNNDVRNTNVPQSPRALMTLNHYYRNLQNLSHGSFISGSRNLAAGWTALGFSWQTFNQMDHRVTLSVTQT